LEFLSENRNFSNENLKFSITVQLQCAVEWGNGKNHELRSHELFLEFPQVKIMFLLSRHLRSIAIVQSFQQSITDNNRTEDLDINGLPCKVINGYDVDCNQTIYTDKVAWRKSRVYINEQIRRLRAQLHELKEIRSHLRFKRPQATIPLIMEYSAQLDMQDFGDEHGLDIEDEQVLDINERVPTAAEDQDDQQLCTCKPPKRYFQIKIVFVSVSKINKSVPRHCLRRYRLNLAVQGELPWFIICF
jgi:hypothetical protein